MSSATETIANAVSAAVAAGGLDREHAEQLVGRLLFDAMGIDLSGDGDDWRQELIALGVPAALIAASQAGMRAIGVWPAAPSLPPLPESTRPSDPAERVLAHIAILGDPSQWETATTYESLALALIDAV